MKTSKFVFCTAFIFCSFFCDASKPIHIGVQMNPIIHLIHTDSTQYVLKQTQWGTNVLARLGFDITKKLSFGIGAGLGNAIETTNYGFYTYGNMSKYLNRGYVTILDKDFYKDFYSENIKTNYILNFYFTYNLPISTKCGFMVELGYKFQLTENIASFNESTDTDGSFYFKRLNFNEKSNSIYLRPTFYYDISSRFRISLNYLNLGYSFGKRIDNKGLFEEFLPHYLIVDPREIKIYNNRISTERQDLFGTNYLIPINQFEFLYGLSSVYLTVYVKI